MKTPETEASYSGPVVYYHAPSFVYAVRYFSEINMETLSERDLFYQFFAASSLPETAYFASIGDVIDFIAKKNPLFAYRYRMVTGMYKPTIADYEECCRVEIRVTQRKRKPHLAKVSKKPHGNVIPYETFERYRNERETTKTQTKGN